LASNFNRVAMALFFSEIVTYITHVMFSVDYQLRKTHQQSQSSEEDSRIK